MALAPPSGALPHYRHLGGSELNMGICAGHEHSDHSRYEAGSGLGGSHGNARLHVLKNCQLFSKMAAPFCTVASNVAVPYDIAQRRTRVPISPHPRHPLGLSTSLMRARLADAVSRCGFDSSNPND